MDVKPFINVPGIKNTFLRRLWILPLVVIMILVALVILIIDLVKTAASGTLKWIVDHLDLVILMFADILKMIKTVWEGTNND